MITTELKKKVAEAIAMQRELFGGSDAQYATSLGINAAIYSRIRKGETERVLADAKWITLARTLEVQIGNREKWQTAATPVFQVINTQLAFHQKNSSWGLLCDDAGIGKTYAAKHYARTNKNAIYIDCSQCKSKRRMVKEIAKAFGCTSTGRYYDMYDDLVYYVKTLANPLIILDEAGDLQYEAFKEVKALWNAVENCCGFYLMGADGLRAKMIRGIENKKVGFAEIFNRHGERFQRITPEGKEAREEFYSTQAAMVIKANAPKDADIKTILCATDNQLRRVYIEIKKMAD